MDSDEESDHPSSPKGVPGTIILINAFETSKYNIFETVHDATSRLIKQHMRLSSAQYIGVYIYGIEESTATTFDFKPVLEAIPLSLPTLDDYNKFKNIDITSFKDAKEFKLSDVLWHCSKMFANCKKQLSSRTVIMLTRLETPPIPIDQSPTLYRATDLVDANIDIRIINISKGEYKIDVYYENLLQIANKGIYFTKPEPIWDPVQIEKLLHHESHRNIELSKLNFEIGKDFNIGVGVYTLLKTTERNYKKKCDLDRDTNALLRSITKTNKVTLDYDEDEKGESKLKRVPLLNSELLYYQEYGGEKVEFTDNELKSLRNPLGQPILRLLGFKPATVIHKDKWYLKMNYFLIPNESIIEGSTVAFKGLYEACRDMDVVAICVLCTRKNAKPVIVALNPSSKPLNLDVEIGFDVIIIPFVENVRDLNINEDDENDAHLPVEEAHKRLMSDIINKLIVDFKPDMFENPKLQSLNRAIEAIALEDDDNEPLIDTTKQSRDKYQEIESDLFEELFGPFISVPLKRTASKLPKQAYTKKKRQ